jgi:hypothetical protein
MFKAILAVIVLSLSTTVFAQATPFIGLQVLVAQSNTPVGTGSPAVITKVSGSSVTAVATSDCGGPPCLKSYQNLPYFVNRVSAVSYVGTLPLECHGFYLGYPTCSPVTALTVAIPVGQ